MKAICVFAGSCAGDEPAYRAAAVATGRTIAQRGLRLVYGGGNVGMMGALADAALQAGGEVVGIIPQRLVEREAAHHGISDLQIVDTMHQRKARMAELADAFLILPGGIGTMEEMFEVWTWGQLGYHHKPFGLLNAVGYFDPLIAFLDHAVAAKFLSASCRGMLIVDDKVEALIDRLEAWR